MIDCMTCPRAPKVGGTTAQTDQRNDGNTAPNTQQLHHRLGHLNRKLHADIEKPTTLEKTFNYLHKINSYIFMEKKLNFCRKKFAFDCWHCDTQHIIHNTKYIVGL